MPSVLRFPATQERDPTDLPDSQEDLLESPPDLMERPKGTTPIRRSSPTIIPDVSFADEPTRPSHHPEVDEAPWGETTAPSALPAEDDFFEDGFVDPAAPTAELPSLDASAPAEAVDEETPPSASLPLLLAAAGVMILLAATAVMLVVAMLQKPEPAHASVSAAVVPAMVAPAQALPAPTIAAPEPVEAVADSPVRRKSKKPEPVIAMEPSSVVDSTPAIVAPPEPEVAAAAEAPEAEKKKKGLFGKKKDR